MKPIRILLADAQSLIHIGQQHLLGRMAEYKIVGQAYNSVDLKWKLKSLKPDVVVIDYHYPGFFSASDIKEIYLKSPSLRVLVVTGNENPVDVRRIIGIGVKNYILKRCNEEEFMIAVHATARGEKYLCSSVENLLSAKVESPEKQSAVLSEREIEIVDLIAQGLSSKEIASRLHLSEYTIGTHRKNMLKKLKFGKSSELVMYAVKCGLIVNGA